jgi:arylsulfatase A-like enzyme
LEAVKRSGVGDDTLIIIIADHGADRGDFDHGIHTDDDNIYVPFIITGPHVRANVALTYQSLVRVIDIAPTLLHALGVPHDHYKRTISGRPLTEHFY